MLRKSKYLMLAILMLILLSACSTNETVEEETPILSSTFSLPVTFQDDNEGEYVLLGEKGKLAFQIHSSERDEIIELSPIYAEQPDKYMWYLWGEGLSNKSFKVIGTNTETGEELLIVKETVLGNELNGADAHTPSSMMFPISGVWKLDAYVDEELFGNIMVEVK
ncbi:hypothetical protein [Halalkalibacter alkalisediminis]|uniref:DUF4871 domain-containing protein n=1 Tax=Halalkalibacter alkalisediminis TaxID=935616 RepID=A0ABV6NLN7_9BACI|nr:hypothetical protein [Halalkalibacter alkalisediminis]